MEQEKKLLFITGCSGRIGERVISRFSGSDYQMVGLDIAMPKFETPANFIFLKMDVSSQESINGAMNEVRQKFGTKVASFIHLAAYYNFTGGEWAKYDEITVQGTRKLLKAMHNFDTEQFLFSSTMLVHEPLDPPQKITEDTPFVTDPWEYPRSKIATEAIMKSERDSIPIVILRIAGCYDDECHSIPISNQIQRIYENQFASHVLPGDISHGTSFLHLDDLAEAIWCSVQKREILPADTVLLVGEEERLSYDQIQNQVSHLVRGKDLHTYRIPKFIAKIGAWLQDKLPFMPKSFIKPWMIDYADDNYDLDMNHTNETLNWKPSRKLQEVLPVMVAELKKDPLKWYQVNGLEAPKWLQKRESNKHA